MPLARATLYCSGVSCARHCSSVLTTRGSCDIGKGPVSLQEADVDFVGLILHGLFRLSSAGLAGGENNDGSDDQGSEMRIIVMNFMENL